MKVLSNLDLNKNELQNARIQNLASAPASPVEGQVYHNTTDHRTYVYNGSAWVDITNAGAVTSVTAGDTTVVIGGTATAPTVKVNSTTLDAKANKDTALLTTSARVVSPATKAAGSNAVDVLRVESSDAQALLAVKQNGDTVIGGNLTVSGTGISTGTDLTLSGNLQVNGSTTLGDDATADTTTIKGKTTIKSKATKAAGSGSVEALRVESSDAQSLLQVMENGDTIIAGVLTVNGAGTSTFAGDVTIGGHLTVAQGATANADLSGTDLTLTGNLVVNGNTTLGNEGTDTTTITGVAILPANTTIGNVSSTELGYLDGVTSSIQTQLNGKASTTTATSGANGLMSAADKAKIDAATAGNTASTIVMRDGSGNFSAGQITATKVAGLSTPTADTDAATKGYVDALKMGFDYKDSVRAASTANIALATGGLLTIDGVTLVAGDRVLVKNQTTASENGIYTAAAGAWSRAADANVSSEVTSGMYAFVSEGTTQERTAWVLSTADPITLGTTSLTFTQFSGAGTYTAGNGITLSGNQFRITSHAGTAGSVGTVVPGADGTLGVSLGTTSTTAAAGNHNHDSSYFTETELGSTTSGSSGAKKIGTPTISGVTGTDVEAQLGSIKTLLDGKEPTITTLPVTKGGTGSTTAAGARSSLGAAASGANSDITSLSGLTTPLSIAQGGTGANTAAAARSNLGATTKYAANVGDGASTTITVTHSLGTQDVVVMVRETVSPFNVVICDIQVFDVNTVKLVFATAPTAGQYRVTVIG